jgi:hypothetical protein
VMIGDKAAARKSYKNFLTLWKDADPDIPIYQQAKAEFAKPKDPCLAPKQFDPCVSRNSGSRGHFGLCWRDRVVIAKARRGKQFALALSHPALFLGSRLRRHQTHSAVVANQLPVMLS